MDWADILNSVVTNTANAYGTVKAADALNHPQVAADGSVYTQGQLMTPALTISPLILLAGAGVLLFMFMQK
jgi:hypothetical protein